MNPLALDLLQAVNFHSEGAGFLVGAQVGFVGENLACQASGFIAVMDVHGFCKDVRQGCLRAVGHDLDGVHEVLAAVVEHFEALCFGQLADCHLARLCMALVLDFSSSEGLERHSCCPGDGSIENAVIGSRFSLMRGLPLRVDPGRPLAPFGKVSPQGGDIIGEFADELRAVPAFRGDGDGNRILVYIEANV
ncbi:MAG: hypothetical protein R3F19_06765 [Verrucomicrobiales bacterium]